jgi:hypothetical protein
MPQAGYEPTIPVSGRFKTIHALNHTATGIDCLKFYEVINFVMRCVNIRAAIAQSV